MNTPAHTEELTQLTEKLKKLALTLHLHPIDWPLDEPIHEEMQKYTDTLCATQWQMNFIISLIQDIITFEGWGTSKLEDWLSDIETAADILRETHVCLTKAKLTHNLVCEAAGKSLDDIFDILHLKLCNANIHIHTSHFMEIQQKENKTLAAYIHHFRMEAKRCEFNNDTAAIHILIKGLREVHSVAEKVYKRTPKLYLRLLNWWRN